MNRLHPLFLGVVVIAAAAIFMRAGPSAADQQADPYHPVIAGHGRITPFPQATIQPAAGHRVVFDISEAADDTGAVHQRLEQVARYLNLLGAAGLKVKQAPTVVVVHGDATDAVLDHAAHQIRHGQNNPNAELLRAIDREGVKLYICGQSLAQRNLDPKQVVPSFEIASSAVSALAAFQMRRYALIPR